MPPAGSRPLTVLERGRLIADCIPFVFLLAGTIVVLTIWSDLTERLTGERTPLVLGAVIGVVLLVTGWIAVKRVRDLLAGSALVAVDTLTRVWRPRRGARRGCYGVFERLGTLRMSARDFARRHRAQRCPAAGAGPGHAELRLAAVPDLLQSGQQDRLVTREGLTKINERARYDCVSIMVRGAGWHSYPLVC